MNTLLNPKIPTHAPLVPQKWIHTPVRNLFAPHFRRVGRHMPFFFMRADDVFDENSKRRELQHSDDT